MSSVDSSRKRKPTKGDIMFKRICTFLMIAAMVIGSATYSSAQLSRHTAGQYYPVDYESITVADTAIGFTSSKISPSSSTRKPARAIITVETAQIRYRVDGTDPTSSEGHILEINDVLILIGTESIRNFKAIRTTSTSGVIKVTYEI